MMSDTKRPVYRAFGIQKINTHTEYITPQLIRINP